MAQDSNSSRKVIAIDLQNKPADSEKEERDQQLEDKSKNNCFPVLKEVKANDQFEKQFQSHEKVSEKAKINYLCAYKQMMSKLRAHQLEPLAEVMRQHEGIELKNLDKLADKISTKLYEEMSIALESFWEEYNIDTSIATLEMLKEQFKNYKGTDWQMSTKTIAERVRPKQMRMKKLKQIYLERQLKYQNERLEKLLEDNKKWRTRIQNISVRRCCLHSEITKRSDRYKGNVPELKKMISELLNLME